MFLPDTVFRDLRLTARSLLRSPVFTLTVVATLALGIGATTVIFSVTDHVVIRPLSYRDVDRLVVLEERIEEIAGRYPSLSANASHFLQWMERCRGCEAMAAMRSQTLTLRDAGPAELLGVVRTAPQLLQILGSRAEHGRLLQAADDAPGAAPVAVLGDGVWRRRFGADTSIIGKVIHLEDRSVTVVGVLAPEPPFPTGHQLSDMTTLPASTDVLVPLALTDRERTTPGEFDYIVIARRARGTSVAEIRSSLNDVEQEIASKSKDRLTLSMVVTPVQTKVTGRASQPLLLLLGAVGAMLLIVCVNLAALLLARHASRQHDAAVRVALGCAPARLVYQRLLESLVLGVVSGAVGLAAAFWGLKALISLAPAELPRLGEITIDGRVAAVAAIVSVLTGVAFGILPAWRSARIEPSDALKTNQRSTPSRHDRRAGSWLVGAQLAVCTALVLVTGLLLASFAHVAGVDRGFESDHVLAVGVSLNGRDWNDPAQRTSFYNEAIRRVGALPGVTRAGVGTLLPLEGEWQVDVLSLENDTRPTAQRPIANIRYASPGYFSVLGVPLLKGRAFGAEDYGHRVTMLTQRAATALFPNEDAVGKMIQPGSNDSTAIVIGITADLRTSGLEREGELAAYVPIWLNPPKDASIMVRTVKDPGAIAASVRNELNATNPSVPITKVRTMSAVVSAALAPRRFALVLIALFAITAVITATVGIYGVVSQSLARRKNEIAIRMALGADAQDIRRDVLFGQAQPVIWGVLIGVGAELAFGRILASQLFGVGSADISVIAIGCGIVATVAIAATWLPAMRAARSDVASVMRGEE